MRFPCFVVLTTVGAAALGAALLAQPVGQYCQDREYLAQRQRAVEQLQQLYDEQEELLAHADHPAILERVAINSLHYLPVELATAEPEQLLPLPASWPELDAALMRIDEDEDTAPITTAQQYAALLNRNHREQTFLALLGGLCICVALTCFCRKG